MNDEKGLWLLIDLLWAILSKKHGVLRESNGGLLFLQLRY
jgi:hypothetical protein